jgi:hypothetical protein
MANIRERAGGVHVRLSGNTQDYATLVDSTPDGAALEKYHSISSIPVTTYHLLNT